MSCRYARKQGNGYRCSDSGSKCPYSNPDYRKCNQKDDGDSSSDCSTDCFLAGDDE